MAKTFSAQVAQHVENYKKRIEATVKASAQDVAEEATKPVGEGGNMHVDTGFLRASLRASDSEMPQVDRSATPPKDAAPGSFRYDSDTVNLVINNAKIGNPLYLGFTASYARVREFHDGFVRLTAQNWQKIVTRNARKAIKAFK